MPQFNAGAVYIESGLLGSSTMQPIQRVTDIKVDYNVPRANVSVMNRGKPLEQRPVINYIPVDVSVGFIKSDNMIEQCLGLVNNTGIAMLITDTKAASATYGIRSMQVAYAPTNSASYNGLLDIKSGVLTSYALQGGVGQPMQGTFSMQCLDMSGSINTTARATTNYTAGLVKPENQSLTGLGSSTALLFTGYGLTGVTIQSFSFSVGFTHVAVQQLGQRFPVERPLTDVVASLQCQGFFEGINNSLTGLSVFQCGYPTYGIAALTMSPSCSSASPSTITMTNPYLDSFGVNGQVGNFSTFSLSLSLPLGPNPLETGDGSVVTIT